MQRMCIAFIGYGEVGHVFARDLLARGDIEVAAFDILFLDEARGPELVAEAQAGGVRPAACAAEAAADAHIVVSAVTAAASLDVAREAGDYLRRGQVLLDINSVSPHTKLASAELAEAMGGDYVEAAVMAPVARPGLAVPILLGGPAAAALAPSLTDIGMNVRVVDHRIGRASATKLCRSIIVKGLEALMVDCAVAAERFGVGDDVFTSLRDTFPGTDFSSLATTMARRVSRHGVRRAEEMREAAGMLRSIGCNPALVDAVADAQYRHAAKC
jgi:3-hydroxyisobutyrate dehydrogenase-like beta-hydroxyacid dehydrogenase